jgi:hypothetical protein
MGSSFAFRFVGKGESQTTNGGPLKDRHLRAFMLLRASGQIPEAGAP